MIATTLRADISHSFVELSAQCGEEYKAHVDCIDSNNQTYSKCRATQAALDKCALDKLVCRVVYWLMARVRVIYPHSMILASMIFTDLIFFVLLMQHPSLCYFLSCCTLIVYIRV